MHGMKRIAFYGAASLLTAGMLFGALFLLPRRAALQQVDRFAARAGHMTRSLESVLQKLDAVADPQSITPARPGSVSTYLASLDTAVAVSNTEPLDVPRPIRNRWRSPAIERYNAVVTDKGFKTAATGATGALERLAGLLGYHHGVMSALRNTLEYDPRQDLSGTDGEMLLASAKAAGVGIGRAIEKLEAQTYPDDPGLQAVIASLKAVETERYAYELAIGEGRLHGTEYASFIAAVDSAQTDMITNRQAFWQPARDKAMTDLRQAYASLSPYNTTLHNLP